MTVAAEIGRTIELIYACAVAPSRTPELLADIAGRFGAHFADNFSRAHDGSGACGAAIGLDRADYEDGMIAQWSSRNPWGKKAPVTEAGAVRATWQFLSRDELERSDMFVDYLDRRGLHEGLRFEIWSDGDGIEDISLLRSFSTGPFSATEIALAQTLMPHLQRAAAVRRRLARAELMTQAGQAALEALDQGVVLVNASARVLFANPAAAALFAEGDTIACRNQTMSAVTPATTRQLDAALGQATQSGTQSRASTVALPSSAGGPALAAVVMPLRWDAAWSQPSQPTALVCLSKRGHVPERNMAVLARLFGLTTAEARVAEMLLHGKSIAEVAKAQNRSLATIRTHVARLFAKTATSRQTDLIRCLLGHSQPPSTLLRIDER